MGRSHEHHDEQKEVQNCCCGKHHPENKVPQHQPQIQTQRHVPNPPQATYQIGQPLYQGQPRPQHPLPSLSQYPQPQHPNLPRHPEAQIQAQQEQFRQCRLGRFLSEALPQNQTLQPFLTLPQYPYATYQTGRQQAQSKPPVQRPRSMPTQQPWNLPQYPVATYQGGQQALHGNPQPRSQIQPQEQQLRRRFYDPYNGLLTPPSSGSSTLSADSSEGNDSGVAITE